jgi:hypothetical protein
MAIRCKITGKHKVQPADNGSCPQCTTTGVPLTQKGFVGAHNVNVSLGEGPQVPVTDEGSRVGDPRDAAVRREIEGNKIRAGKAALPEGGVPDPVFTTGHNRGPATYRGRDMAPVQPQRGFAAAAGTMHGATGRVRMDREEMVGGNAYGYLARSQYERLSRTQQRKYWARVGKARRFAADRRRNAVAALPVRLGTGGAGGASFADGDSRETEHLMRQPRS